MEVDRKASRCKGEGAALGRRRRVVRAGGGRRVGVSERGKETVVRRWTRSTDPRSMTGGTGVGVERERCTGPGLGRRVRVGPTAAGFPTPRAGVRRGSARWGPLVIDSGSLKIQGNRKKPSLTGWTPV